MANKILLTSFDTWLPHQKSNSSDDLLNAISKRTDANYHGSASLSLTFLRQLPVDVELASCCVIAKINELQPDGIICCGMAECRTQLTVESNAKCGNTLLKTPLDLKQLVAGSHGIEISHDAGRFVCEGLYYSVLNYLGDRNLNTRCIFVHVPILDEKNFAGIMADFRLIIHNLHTTPKSVY